MEFLGHTDQLPCPLLLCFVYWVCVAVPGGNFTPPPRFFLLN